MALEWKLSLKDGISGPADKGAQALTKLAKALHEVKEDAAHADRLESALKAPFERAAAAAKKQAEQMKKALSDQRAGGVKSFWGESLLKMGKAIKGASLAEVGAGIAGVAAAVGAAAVDLSADLMGSGIKAGIWFATAVGEAQKFKAATLFAFEQITHSKTGAEAIWNKTTKSALFLGSDFKETMAGMNGLLARGFKADFADELIRRLADLKQINPGANLEGLIHNIAKIKATGHLQGDELVHLSDAGLNVADVYKQIAKAMKLTDKPGQDINAQLVKLQAAGKIKSDVAVDAIMATLRDASGGKEAGALANERANHTMDGAIARAMTMKDALLANVNIDWSPIHRALDKVMAAMESPKGQKFLQTIGDAISGVLGRLDQISPDDLGKALDKGTAAAGVFGSVIGQALDLAIALGPELALLTDLALGFIAAEGTTMGLIQSLFGMINNLGSLLSGLSFFGEGQGIGTSITDGILSGITGGQMPVVSAVVALCEAAIGAGNTTNKVGSPAKVWVDMYRFVGAGAVEGTNRMAPQVVAANENVARSAADAARGALAPTPISSGNVGYGAGRAVGSMISNTTSSANTNTIDSVNIKIDGAKDPHATGVEVANNIRSIQAGNG
jgi:hypothetical protein